MYVRMFVMNIHQFYSIYKYWHTTGGLLETQLSRRVLAVWVLAWHSKRPNLEEWKGILRIVTNSWWQLSSSKKKMQVWRLSKDSDDLSSFFFWDMGVSKNRGTPKSSILIGFSIINHPFWGTPIFGNTHIVHYPYFFATLWQGPIGPSHIIVVRVIWVRTCATWCITWW